MGLLITESKVQIYLSETWRKIRISTVADNGINIAPARKSATAILGNRILTDFCSSFLRLTAIITNKFKRMVTGEAKATMKTKIQEVVVLFKSQVKFGYSGQKNTDLVLFSVCSVLLTSIL